MLSSFVAISVLLFLPYGIYVHIHSVRDAADDCLQVAAYSVREFLPDNYHENLLTGKISDAEYSELQKKIEDFKEKLGVSFLYCIMLVDGKYVYTLSEDAKPYEPAIGMDKELAQLYKEKKKLVFQSPDEEYGIISRTVLLPFEMSGGDIFVVGADLDVDIIRPMIIASLKHLFAILFCGLALILLLTLLMSRSISAPMIKLSNFAKKLGEKNFSSELSLKDELGGSAIKTKEFALLVSSMEFMRAKLAEYVKNLEVEVRARENAQAELRLAGELQMSFLPANQLSGEGFEISAYLKPAKEAGGDLYAFSLQPSGEVFFAVGDVSGKGMPAALEMARVIALIRAGAKFSDGYVSLVKLINAELCRDNESCNFLTFLCGVFNPQTGVLRYVNCGHNYPYLKKTDAAVRVLKTQTDPILGVIEDMDFHEQTLALQKGESFICYTDGANEAINEKDEFFGDSRLADAFAQSPKDSGASGILTFAKNKIFEFQGLANQADDITFFVLQRK